MIEKRSGGGDSTYLWYRLMESTDGVNVIFPERIVGVGVVSLLMAGLAMGAGLSTQSKAQDVALASESGSESAQGSSRMTSQWKDVPFRATQVIVRRGANGVVETQGRVARNSAGSTYVELIDETTKMPAEVLIFDVPNHRELVLDVRNRRYRSLAAPALDGKSAPVDFVAEQLRVAAEQKDTSVHVVKDGVDSTRTRLGVRRVGGLETVGSVEVRRPVAAAGERMDGPAEMDESWISVDLGIAVLRTKHDPLRAEDTEVALTAILRAEPDAKLFQVPAGYVLDDGRAEVVRPAAR